MEFPVFLLVGVISIWILVGSLGAFVLFKELVDFHRTSLEFYGFSVRPIVLLVLVPEPSN